MKLKVYILYYFSDDERFKNLRQLNPMKIEDHWKNLKESLEVLGDSIEKGLIERQRTIGFNASAAATDMLEILLHQKSLIDPGFVVKHDWFNSRRKLEEKFHFDFPSKKEILELMFKIEEKRNILCYGKPQKVELIEKTILDFNQLKDKFKEAGLNEL